ncbi:mitochondrial inner membrane protease subunit 2 isoform X6 [Carcharodon carcharias]|uniref:mitochondrial inner membrane protease subunit 2 isoform X6 n=1 Tax=Carcharodon carcharias TaxID=13397 RepID=UPI001B7F6C1B|nr:mitochondrial inner membrane protease subunit 2 isoform X6 [Carcharodon carcharias]
MELAPLGLIMARAAGFGKRYLKAFVSGFFVAVPVTVTFLDRVAYIARVEGASMQPSLNPPGRTTCDIVLLNRWSVRNYEVQRGDIVSLVLHAGFLSSTLGCLLTFMIPWILLILKEKFEITVIY